MKQLVKTVIVIVAMSAALYSCSDEQEAVKIPPRQEAQPKPQEPLEELPEFTPSEDLTLVDDLREKSEDNKTWQTTKTSQTSSKTTTQLTVAKDDDAEENSAYKNLPNQPAPNMGIVRKIDCAAKEVNQ